jgi:hypothetical protein
MSRSDGEKRNSHKILVGIREGNRAQRRAIRRIEYDIKIDLTEIYGSELD